MLRLLTVAFAALFVLPAFAQDACVSADDAVTKLKSHGDTIAADIPVPGADVDRLIVDIDTDGIWLWASKAGCIVGAPLPLDQVQGAKPKLQGSGLEIGA